MKISLDWLKQYIKWDEDPSQLIEIFNNIGLVVDDWKERDGDIILDMETYANRPDTLGHIGVARELAAALRRQLTEENWPVSESGEKTEAVVDIQIHEETLCPRYCGLVIRDVPVGPSPEWLVRRIRSMGLNPVNNVVDVTNYILFSTAQPIHAFDLSRLEGEKIIVRRANKGESLKTLDDKVETLSTDMLVIADERKPVALAGIVGGQESAVTEKTNDVFIESAYFSPVSIRKTAKELGIQTDASYRFERGADISVAPQAAQMAASILTQMGGKGTRGVFDVYPKPRKKKTLILRKHRITDLLGVDVPDSEIEDILRRLEFTVTREQTGLWKIQVP
ncbi:MAG: phenylalanine--tRNA ligase subunit beta, partial [Acidobacteriota bacterium]